MKRLYTIVMLLFAAIVMVGCGTEENRLILPPNNNPPQPSNPSTPSEYPLISTDPAFVTEAMTEDITVILNTAGTAADGFTGELYAHAGVLTENSTSNGDWKYVLSDWGQNIPECKLESKGDNIWHYTIKGGVHAWYGVPDSEKVTHLAFVFRSADCSIEVKDNGADIFVELATEGLSVKIISPAHGAILQVGQEYTVQVQQQAATSVKLFKNDTPVAETGGATLSYTYAPTEPEDVVFKAVATDGTNTVEESVKVAVLGETENAIRPADAKNGVTVNGNEATFVLFAPGKQSVVLLGDFNDYAPSNESMMKRDGDYFWITISGLEEGVEYGYQYLVDGTIKIGDPYATKILDPWNDKWISASVYPNLKAYPAEYTSDIVSVFELNPAEYNWTATSYERPAENSLAIYELLIRDFTEEGSINAVTAKLDYLETLGVNAIELMPIQEFDGNDSWGYNPCFFFAADKAYGTEEAYKTFIDECHKRGIAVILDVVFNHATGQHPYAKMWWDGGANKTTSNNPFFNVDAPHNWSVFHDFNHTYQYTVEYIDDVLEYWMEEYNVDGFRFDLTKGFVQNPGNYDASGYSAQRIGILKHYAETIRAVDEDAYIIFEHFCDQSEETELYNSVGALCWNNNQRGGYKESVLGFTGGGKSNFSDFKKGRINNIETHDEERIAYDAIKYAQSWAKPWDVLTKRLQAVYAFHFLTPYPKMMWQFGELGYDVSIEENGRTGRKPVRWNYFEDANRKALYDAMSKYVSWRTDHEEYYGQDNLSVHTWNVNDSHMSGKTLVMDKVIVVANFTNAQASTTINNPNPGEWTNLMTGEKVQVNGSHTFTLGGSDYIVLVRE
ncbi:MAG: Por secretion system protein [Alistipes sp.]|nr:Por secretion system protein [Alistipes sp.]